MVRKTVKQDLKFSMNDSKSTRIIVNERNRDKIQWPTLERVAIFIIGNISHF